MEIILECFKRNGYIIFGCGKIFYVKLEVGREEVMFDNCLIFKGGFGFFGEEVFWVGG